jgi:hypothetical protein
MRYGQLVIGPAGSGKVSLNLIHILIHYLRFNNPLLIFFSKSTYCATFQEHCKVVGRTVFVVNLDPAAEQFRYECSIDIRAMLSVDEVLEASKEAREIMGPNGALVYW